MKKILSMILILCLALSLCACGDDEKTVENPKLRIGVFEPFTGPDSVGGLQEVLGIQYAHSQTPTVKIGGQTYDVELVYADNASSELQAASVAAALLEQGVSIVLGSYGSGVSMAAADVFEKAGVAALGISCTNPAITADYDSYYRVCYQDELQGAVLAHFAFKELGVDTVYCLGQVENEYDQGLINAFRAAAQSLGITVLKADFAENCTDFSYYITNAAAQGADVIFAPCAVRYAKTIIEQMEIYEIGLPILSGDTWDSETLLAYAYGKDIKIYVSAFYTEGGSTSFENGFRAWLAEDEARLANNGGTDSVAAVSVMGYDAYNMALAAAKAAGSAHHADILAVMPSVSGSGVTGIITFDDIGDAVRTSAYIKRADTASGSWKFIKKQTIE